MRQDDEAPGARMVGSVSGEAGAIRLGVVLLVSASLFHAGCTTFYERGVKVASIGGDLDGFRMRTADGTWVEAKRISHSVIHKAVGGAVAAGALGIGTAAATSGVVTLFKP